MLQSINNIIFVPQKVGKNTRLRLVYMSCPIYTSFMLYRFLRALQQNRPQSRLLYLLHVIVSLTTSVLIGVE